MSRKKNAASAGGNQLWDQAEEMPRAGLPDAIKMARRQRFGRIVVWACVLSAPLMALTTFSTLANQGAGAGTSAVVVDKYATTRPVALSAVRDWLAADPSPVPNGQVIDWVKATTKKTPKVEGNQSSTDTPYRVETHVVTVSGPYGLYDAAVSLVIRGTGVAVMSAPSLTPQTPLAESAAAEASLWPSLGEASAEASDAVVLAVQQWADQFTGDNPDALRQVTRDKEAGHTYLPLFGANLIEASVGSAAKTGKAGEIVASVTLTVSWDGQTIKEAAEAPSMTFDVLIHDANSGAPYVVAWGGPGSGPDLKPDSNAVKGIDLSSTQLADPDTAIDDAEPADGDAG